MIEWIPIKDYKFTEGREFLVLLRDKLLKDSTEIMQAYMIYHRDYVIIVSGRGDFTTIGKSLLDNSGFYITHIASINMPVEKTIEEKFRDFCNEIDDRVDWATLHQLSKIAEEHYEGEK